MEAAKVKDDGGITQVGNRKGKKKKQKTITIETTFQPSIDSITMFGKLKLAPPANTDELDAKIEELQKERVKYVELQQEAEKNVTKVTDEELLREIEQEEKERRRNREEREGGRGGPRVTRGAARGAGRGRGRRDFDHGSDDEEPEQKPAQRKQRRADLANLDNFPTL